MAFIGIEEIFLEVKDLDKAIDFYHRLLGIPLDKHDDERAYLQTEQGHVVLQIRTPKAETSEHRRLYEQLARAMPFNPRERMGV